MQGHLTASLILCAAVQRENLRAQHFQSMCFGGRAAESIHDRFGARLCENAHERWMHRIVCSIAFFRQKLAVQSAEFSHGLWGQMAVIVCPAMAEGPQRHNHHL
jgi:hypothetical protein